MHTAFLTVNLTMTLKSGVALSMESMREGVSLERTKVRSPAEVNDAPECSDAHITGRVSLWWLG